MEHAWNGELLVQCDDERNTAPLWQAVGLGNRSNPVRQHCHSAIIDSEADFQSRSRAGLIESTGQCTQRSHFRILL